MDRKNTKNVKVSGTAINKLGRINKTFVTQYIVNQYLLRPPNI